MLVILVIQKNNIYKMMMKTHIKKFLKKKV